MSCGCNVPKGDFAPEKDTWTRQSSLTMQNWDPYPELQSNKCSENYKSREKFVQNLPCCNANPYNNLNKTWAPQQDYSL